MKEESLLLLSDLQKLINQVVLIDYTIIILGDKTGYVPINALTPIGNVDTLNAEFNSIGNDYESIYEEMLELQRQKRNRMIWGSIIVVLVIAIFGVGIVSAVKKNREEN